MNNTETLPNLDFSITEPLGRLRSSLESELLSSDRAGHTLALQLTKDGLLVQSIALSSELIKSLVSSFSEVDQKREAADATEYINPVEASRLLNVSTAFVHSLEGRKQFHAVVKSGQKLLPLHEILEYKRHRHASRMNALQELVDESQALNLGY